MEHASPAKPITQDFNIALLLFSVGLGFTQFYFSDKARDVPVAGLVMTTVFNLARFLVVIVITANFVREFWNRVVSGMLSLRSLTTHEAVAFALL